MQVKLLKQVSSVFCHAIFRDLPHIEIYFFVYFLICTEGSIYKSYVHYIYNIAELVGGFNLTLPDMNGWPGLLSNLFS